ncbi:hypothetical protein NPIL_634881 [Nephila pilipes]|uniref:Uncharacterized protein n=1 Tax=Nephila pilipes TaxID=299642 RepID=A0A8X6TI55_NEPPI|nr:hypothetical protein NPIL_634881 [Nephila pilipes]
MVYTVDPGYRHTAETIVLGGISIMVCTKSLNGRRIATIPILKWVLHQCGNLGGLINSNSRIGRGTKISDAEYLRLQLQQDYLICMTCSRLYDLHLQSALLLRVEDYPRNNVFAQ